MKKILLSLVILFVFSISTTQANAWWPFATVTPTFTPTPTPQFLQIKPGLILDKSNIIEMAVPTTLPTNTPTTAPTPSNTQTPTPTPTSVVIVVTATPAVQANGSIAPTQEAATDAGTATPSPTSTQAGMQTKDIVTYGLIGAILLVLLVQGFMPKKGAKPEAKSEEPKIGE